MTWKMTPTAITPSSTHISVLMSIETGHAQQVAVVRIPLDWLLDDQTRTALDRAYRRALIEKWSGVEIDTPLPL